MDDQQYLNILEKLGDITLQNKQLRKANIKKDKKIKHLRRVIKKLKEDAANNRKPHYKNGKRGTKFNG